MKISKFWFTIKPQKELFLPPYKGSTFRGGFGHAFKRAVCMERNDDCIQCSTRHNCVYSYVFNTSILQEIEKGERFPHPFIIEPPLEDKEYYGINDRLDFHLILVGRAVDYIPYFIFAFEELGRMGIGRNKGKYFIETVISIYKDKEIIIYDGNSHFKDSYRIIESFELVIEAAQLNYHQVTFNFITPTRIKYDGKLIVNINFEIFLKNLLRRLSGLANVHCNEKWDLEWKQIIDKAKNGVRTVHSDLKWYDWERYSQRQGTKMKMGGFMGEITFEGELGEFMPFIKLGEYLHVGKGTVFGLGKYEFKGE